MAWTTIIFYPNDNLVDDVHSNKDYYNIKQEQTIHNNLHTLADNKLQLRFDLEDPNGANDWKSTNSHKGELVTA